MASATFSPLAPNLKLDLPDSHIPWAISPETFAKLTNPTKEVPYRITQLFPTDPEWAFVWDHFHHQKPTKYSLGKVLIIHERHQQQAFELNLSTQEREASKFLPNWDQEPRAPQRAEAIQRWKDTTAQFSPFESMESDGRRRTWEATKILPLFHGTSKDICHSICESGHTYFGKTTLAKKAGDPHSTDDGYFGSGIYFTNSARYAADIYSHGHLLISWVSMREPFPVVGNPTQEDMKILHGKGAYSHYNAHYAPVASLNPADPNCPEYYPTQAGQAPTYDEYVVFQKAQTLPRFWIHLVVDALFLKALSIQPEHVEDLIPHLMTILQNPQAYSDKKVRNYLNEKLAYLLRQTPDDYLDDHDLSTLHEQLKTLFDATGKVNRAAVKALTGGPASSLPVKAAPQAATPLPKPPTQYEADLAKALEASLKMASQASSATAAPVKTLKTIPAQAFGALKWAQYFDVQVVEPPLPPDIDQILAGPCPFFPGKKVSETQLLTLIPEGMTLERLETLVCNSRQGNKIGFRNKGSSFEQHQKNSAGKTHWALITNDVIPGSRKKSWKDQQTLAGPYRSQGYELPSLIDVATSLILEYVQTGRRFYTDSPSTYSRCVEQYVSGSSQYPMIVGGFASAGLVVGSDNVSGSESRGVGLARKFY